MTAFYEAHVVLIQTSLVYILLAASVQVTLVSGVFSLASIGFWQIGEYTTAILSQHGYPVALIFILVIFESAILGYALSFAFARLRGLYLAMATLAFDLIIPVVLTNGGSFTGGATGLFAIPASVSVFQALLVVVVVCFVLAKFERGWRGRAFINMREDEDLALSVGIRVSGERRLVFVLSACLGATSGVLYAMIFQAVSPEDAGFPLIVLALSMAIIGGRNTWIGAAIGAIILTWLPQLLHFVGVWDNLVYGVILVVIIMFAPSGLVGLVRYRSSAVGATRWIKRVVARP
jgi:branched-chain amino acid transport system permease protein